ncbi:MAG TPA: aspartate-semialdehyde dehydrogenase [Saprospiraceae bacterium]|nr:aspartate-semialdehyde dehydrogenase [Saprospiraceae bacterium]
MRVAVVGATGLVGRKMLDVLEERNFPVDELIPVASEKSVGQLVKFCNTEYRVQSMQDAINSVPDLALFSAGGSVSKEWTPRFTERGTYVVDNSSAWRMDPSVPLIVPEVNAHVLRPSDKLIANPNCSTIQMVVALAPLHRRWRIRRLVISTYQSVSGTGKAAVDQYTGERDGRDVKKVYPHPIFENCIPQCDIFLDNGYTREEMKMVNETRKIMEAPDIAITATAVRVPVLGGHSESVNVEFESDFDVQEVRDILAASRGIIVQDDPATHLYPMALYAHDTDAVYIGRLRKDEGNPRTLNLWIVADNLRKGAATNAIQIAEFMYQSAYFTQQKAELIA